MNRFVVFTTINPPSEALQAWAKIDGLQLIGVGDKKTPVDWHLDGCKFLSTWHQNNREQSNELVKLIPWNNYGRKMLGYQEAIKEGAEVIIDTDDDNIPKSDWSVPEFEGENFTTSVDREWFNAYRVFSDKDIWPRGFPLEKIIDSRSQDQRLGLKTTRVGVWQCLVDGDPDVDAIYRLTNNEPITFNERPPLVLGRGVWCPFNSQNTVWRKELFPLLYLPVTVSMRFSDILRSLVAQPIMAEKGGYQLGFTKANAVQKRNPHNYLDDFKEEVPVYLNAQRVINIVTKGLNWKRSLEHNICVAYLALKEEGIVKPDEITSLAFWLKSFIK
jgi:STELLO glycosyltransferases